MRFYRSEKKSSSSSLPASLSNQIKSSIISLAYHSCELCHESKEAYQILEDTVYSVFF